jgi:hypothetical protein
MGSEQRDDVAGVALATLALALLVSDTARASCQAQIDPRGNRISAVSSVALEDPNLTLSDWEVIDEAPDGPDHVRLPVTATVTNGNDLAVGTG